MYVITCWTFVIVCVCACVRLRVCSKIQRNLTCEIWGSHSCVVCHVVW